MRRLARILALLIAALAFASCEGGGNSGSETTNGLAGIVRDVEGRPVAGARARLLPEDYDPAGASADTGMQAPAIAATNRIGAYRMADLVPGRYHLEVSDSAHGTLTLVPGVEITAEGFATADATLGKPGALTVRIADFLGAGESGYLYIPGTGVWLPVDSAARDSGSATLRPVPVGRYPQLLLVAGAPPRTVLVAEDFEVFSESTAALPAFASWKHARKIPINTLAAGVKGTVADFPLLVRLGDDFAFAEARADGGDIRFAKADGAPIPFQIERWDPAAKRAEIWARMDTVEGGSPDQYISLYWGREAAAADLPGPKVFEAAAGFAAVYHLDEAATDQAGGYKDAGPYGNDATAATLNADAQVEGIVGKAKAFAGAPLSTAGILTAAAPHGFQGDAGFTVSFWIRFQATSTRQAVMDFGSLSTLRDVHFLIRPDTNSQFGAYDLNRASGTDPATWQNVIKLGPYLGAWTHVATVYDPFYHIITTYLDGVKAGEDPAPAMDIDAAGGLRIGRQLSTHPLDTPFNGALDEIRFYNRVLSADRILLEYQTQKP